MSRNVLIIIMTRCMLESNWRWWCEKENPHLVRARTLNFFANLNKSGKMLALLFNNPTPINKRYLTQPLSWWMYCTRFGNSHEHFSPLNFLFIFTFGSEIESSFYFEKRWSQNVREIEELRKNWGKFELNGKIWIKLHSDDFPFRINRAIEMENVCITLAVKGVEVLCISTKEIPLTAL